MRSDKPLYIILAILCEVTFSVGEMCKKEIQFLVFLAIPNRKTAVQNKHEQSLSALWLNIGWIYFSKNISLPLSMQLEILTTPAIFSLEE